MESDLPVPQGLRQLLGTPPIKFTLSVNDAPAEFGRRQVPAELLCSPQNVSAASIWEIAIKHSIGKRNMPISAREALRYFRESGYFILQVSAEHAAFVETLPPYHKDPFDRMLVAQALLEPLRLLTHDQELAKYSDTIILV